MNILNRYLLREIGLTFLGVTGLLLLIFISGTLVRILVETLEGDYPATLMFALLGLKGAGSLMLVVPIALFLSVLLALGRLYHDSEMAAMLACGIGPEQILRSVARVAVFVTVVVAWLALFFSPWAEEMSHQLLDEAAAKPEIEGINAGRFNILGDGNYLVYVESLATDRRSLSQLFAHALHQGQEYLVTSSGAHEVRDPQSGDRYLVLENGFRYEGKAGQSEFNVVQFREHGLLLKERAIVPSKRRRNAASTLSLLGSSVPADQAELQWRIAVPISTLLLALLAVPLSRTAPREGRFGRLIAGILLYIVYNNLLSVARSALGKGELSFWVGTWWVHLLLVAVLLGFLWNQSQLRAPCCKKGVKRAPA
ncbi:MAG TPA: LPS export ABC transporter permease LptF [Gammaproteobacteria bacterium]